MFDPTEDPFRDEDSPQGNADNMMFVSVIAVLLIFGLLLWVSS